ncbi:MAG TPA: hypothetical protein DGT23_03330 [Micromonosporaceae bacterium]|nr:hypothetical protein [Micromonosporaceae bacterium]
MTDGLGDQSPAFRPGCQPDPDLTHAALGVESPEKGATTEFAVDPDAVEPAFVPCLQVSVLLQQDERAGLVNDSRSKRNPWLQMRTDLFHVGSELGRLPWLQRAKLGPVAEWKGKHELILRSYAMLRTHGRGRRSGAVLRKVADMYLIRRLSRHPLLVDALFAFAVGVLAVLGSIAAGADQTDMTRLDTVGFALLVIGAAGLVLRRRMPGGAVAITFIVTMLYIYLRYPYGPIFIYATIAIYSAAAWRSTRFAVSAVALAVLAHVPWSLWGEREPDSLAFTTLTTAVWLASPLAVGVAVRTQRQAHAKSLLEERDRHAYEERLRIAQEVHDVVGHSLAVISMNAGAALHVLTKHPGPPQVSESLRAIRQASGGALDELRATLMGGSAKPGLANLADLVEATNVGGLTVTLKVTGTPDGLASKVDLAGYRIVQESLANVVRHAGAKQADVAVEYGPGQITLIITDDGRGGPIQPGGSGLQSMSERAKTLGGVLTARPKPGRGFEVHAVLPYEPGEQ